MLSRNAAEALGPRCLDQGCGLWGIDLLPKQLARVKDWWSGVGGMERADRLVAVWDGTPPSGKGGGTADTVESARAAGLPVDVVWPTGATRQSTVA